MSKAWQLGARKQEDLVKAGDARDVWPCAGAGRLTQPVSYFRIVAQGPSYADPVEKIVTTAVEAEQAVLSMTRLCGRSGSVVLYDRRGGKIGPRKLSSLVREEKGKQGQGAAPPGLAC